MKLLLDENISRRIVAALQEGYAGTTHVVTAQMATASDSEIWAYARANDYVIVSKDDDFVALSALHGHPPRLINLSLGNCSNSQVLNALTSQRSLIERAFTDPEVSTVELIAGS